MIKTVAATTPMLVEAWKTTLLLTLDESLHSSVRKPFQQDKYATLAKYIRELAEPSDTILLLSPKTANGFFVTHAVIVDQNNKLKFDTNKVNSTTLYFAESRLYRRTQHNDKTWFRVAASIDISEFLSEHGLSHLLDRKKKETEKEENTNEDTTE